LYFDISKLFERNDLNGLISDKVTLLHTFPMVNTIILSNEVIYRKYSV
jgi:hypothetical protein